jgi:DNA replication protein DnaC
MDLLPRVGNFRFRFLGKSKFRLTLNQQTAKLFFQLISKRYEKGSIIVTTNKPFEQWGEIYSDDVIAAAVLDRLLHHSYPFYINGQSYRLKNIKNIKK